MNSNDFVIGFFLNVWYVFEHGGSKKLAELLNIASGFYDILSGRHNFLTTLHNAWGKWLFVQEKIISTTKKDKDWLFCKFIKIVPGNSGDID